MVGELIGAVFLGIVAGYLARALVPGKQDIGFLWTVGLGVGGAIVGYFFFTELLGIGDDDTFDFGGLIGAVIGSILLLLVYMKVAQGSTSADRAPVEPGDREDRQRERDRAREERAGDDQPEEGQGGKGRQGGGGGGDREGGGHGGRRDRDRR